jgi:uncharacterized membrane protein YtjA (UPF0391 family)
MYGPYEHKGLEMETLAMRTRFPRERTSFNTKGGLMLRWALAFFVIALIAAVFGFLGIAAAAVSVARLLFFVFLVLFLVSLLGGLLRRA